MTPELQRFVALFRAELKIVTARWEFWAFFLSFMALLLTYLSPLFSGRPPQDISDWERIWIQTVERRGFVGLIISSALVGLLAGSEFEWGTARQNVAHGMSEFGLLLTKLQQVGIVAGAFWVGTVSAITVAGLFAWSTRPVLSEAAVLALVGFLIALLGYGLLAFSVAMLVRKTAAAMGLWFLYALVIEPKIATAMEARGDTLQLIGQALPVRLYGSLLRPATFEVTGNMDGVLSSGATFLLAGAHVVLLISLSWLVLIKRDL